MGQTNHSIQDQGSNPVTKLDCTQRDQLTAQVGSKQISAFAVGTFPGSKVSSNSIYHKLAASQYGASSNRGTETVMMAHGKRKITSKNGGYMYREFKIAKK